MTQIPDKIPEIITLGKEASTEKTDERISEGKSSQGYKVTHSNVTTSKENTTKSTSKPILQLISDFFSSLNQLRIRLVNKIVPVSMTEGSALRPFD